MADHPKVLLDIDQGFPPVTNDQLSGHERMLIEAVLTAGAEMRDADGLRRPFLIPPAVALAAVRGCQRIVSFLDDKGRRLKAAAHSDPGEAPAELDIPPDMVTNDQVRHAKRRAPSNATAAQILWLVKHPEHRPVGKPARGLVFRDKGTLYADGRFEPFPQGLIPVKLEPGCFAAGAIDPLASSEAISDSVDVVYGRSGTHDVEAGTGGGSTNQNEKSVATE